MTSKDNSLLAILHVSLSSIPDCKLLSRGDMNSLRADLIIKLVNKSGVSEGTSCHDLEVSSSCAIGVEVFGLNTVGLEIACSWRVVRNLTSGRDVIGGNGVTEVQDAVSALNVINWLRRRLG